MTRSGRFAAALFAGHVAYGAALLAVPDRITKSWLGPAVVGEPAKVALRGIAGREIALHGAAIADALRGRPLLPWLLVSLAGDVNDAVATVAGRRGLPAGAATKTLAVAGGSALLTAAALAGAARE